MSYNDRMDNYRKMERKEPYFTKFQPNVVEDIPRRQNRVDLQGGPKPYSISNRPNSNLYEGFQKFSPRTIKEEHIPQPDKDPSANHIQRKEHINKNDYYHRPQQESRIYQTRGFTRFPTRPINIETTQATVVYRTQTRTPIQSEQHRTVPRTVQRVSIHQVQDVTWRSHSLKQAHITITNPTTPPSHPSIPPGETTTESHMDAYRRYKEQYEFPDYLSEKRRILRAKEKELKRKLYAGKKKHQS